MSETFGSFAFEPHPVPQVPSSPATEEAPLRGLTVGIKDVIETADMPTALGSQYYRGRQTGRDAAVVSLLREAGATVVGKTTTAEFAYRDAPDTRNPLDPTRTPGGSSSGSAAAVAGGLVDFALGTQTGGSIIRPAAYCGVVGFKPSYGLVPTSGVMQLAPTFDTVGVLARDVATVVTVAGVIAGIPPAEPLRGAPRVGLLPADATQCELEMVAALQLACDLIGAHGAEFVEVEIPVARLRELHALINAYEGARSLRAEGAHAREQTRGLIERGMALTVHQYAEALAELEALRPRIDQTLGQVDVVLSPASLGLPPVGLTHTGGSDYCQPWSAARVPAISLPLHPVTGGLPLGIQLVAPRWSDAELLARAAWFERVFARA